MIEYIRPEDPDDRILKKACDFLLDGKIIAFPTDSTWVLAVQASSKVSVKILLKLLKSTESSIPHILCQNLSEIGHIVHLVNEQFKILNNEGPGPYVNVFDRPKGLKRELAGIKEHKSIGVKWIHPLWCKKLVELFEGIIFCIPLTSEMVNEEIPLTDIYSFLIEENLGNFVELIIDPGEFDLTGNDEIRDFTSELIMSQEV